MTTIATHPPCRHDQSDAPPSDGTVLVHLDASDDARTLARITAVVAGRGHVAHGLEVTRTGPGRARIRLALDLAPALARTLTAQLERIVTVRSVGLTVADAWGTPALAPPVARLRVEQHHGRSAVPAVQVVVALGDAERTALGAGEGDRLGPALARAVLAALRPSGGLEVRSVDLVEGVDARALVTLEVAGATTVIGGRGADAVEAVVTAAAAAAQLVTNHTAAVSYPN